ncbi:type II secretion system F family protein [Patescibacteria group bacterium]|nr:type II secretion system F family protein [Patescibacteria group bacterium]
MPTFKYRVRLPDGRLQAGLIQAEDQTAAQAALEEREMEVLLLEQQSGRAVASTRMLGFMNRIKPKDLVVMSRTLSVMVSASVPLTEAVRNIAHQTTNPTLRAVMIDIASDVEGGGRLSDALEKHSKVFSGFFVNMIRSGETSGQLSEVLEYLADQQEKDYDLNSKIRGAMIYPAFIMGTMVVIGFVMMTFVVPKLVSVLQDAGVELPLSTRILIAVSGFFVSYWWLIILLVIGSVVGVRIALTTPEGRYIWDSIKIRIPIFGQLFQRVYVVRFARSLATLMKGGVDMVGALQIVAGVMENEVWRQLVLETIREVNDGNSLTTVFDRYPFVPKMMNQMLVVGETSGRTQEVLNRLSTFFSREVDNVVANLVALIEPLVLILLGLGVGTMVSAILLPLYSLSSGG